MSDATPVAPSLFAPIDPQVDALGAVELPSTAIALCTLRYPDSGPLLRPLIERAVEGALEGEREKRQLIRALYIAGGRRDPLVFEPLLRLFDPCPCGSGKKAKRCCLKA
jgi:SEC-C motif